MTSVSSVLSRRSDLGTFLVHLTRSSGATSAKESLLSILRNCRIEARTAYGQAAQLTRGVRAHEDSQKVVCFTETPLQYLNLLVERIEGRQVAFEPYGLALTKPVARRRGVNPVWYVDITPGYGWLTTPLNNLIQHALNADDFADSDVAKIAPYIEQMGTMQGQYRKEFWWEREWRHVGHFQLVDRFIGIAPYAEHDDLSAAANAADLRFAWIDASWGLEQVIGHLAGYASSELGINE